MKDKQTILIIGATGQIGSKLLTTLPENDLSVIGTSRNQHQISGDNNVIYDLREDIDEKITLSDFDWCIICAAETSIKKCNTDPSNSHFINVERTINLIDKCYDAEVKVLFLSSVSVFDGSKALCTVDDTPNPTTTYGKQKLEVENYILEHHKNNCSVVRLTKVIDSRTPLIMTWRENLSAGKTITAFTNKLLSPLPSDNVCELILTIVKRNLNGTFQLGGSQELSYYEFATQYFGGSANILPAVSDEPQRHASLEAFLPTYEFQYDSLLSAPKVDIGLMANHAYSEHPKHLLFTLSRYKFVSKMLKDSKNVLEIGCADAFGSALVLNEVERLTCCDIDTTFINHAKRTHHYKEQISFVQNDFVAQPLTETFDGIFLMDVLEHISPNNEHKFLTNIIDNLADHGVAILGIPSLESQVFASEISRQGHVNCKNAEELKRFLLKFFRNVFIFSMNDEVVHTGFYPLAHYLIALCCSPRREEQKHE